MAAERVPISHFIEERYGTRPVQLIVENWRVEPRHVIDRLCEHFREMGIYAVDGKNERLVLAALIHALKHSPEIWRLVIAARREEARNNRARHTD